MIKLPEIRIITEELSSFLGLQKLPITQKLPNTQKLLPNIPLLTVFKKAAKTINYHSRKLYFYLAQLIVHTIYFFPCWHSICISLMETKEWKKRIWIIYIFSIWFFSNSNTRAENKKNEEENSERYNSFARYCCLLFVG